MNREIRLVDATQGIKNLIDMTEYLIENRIEPSEECKIALREMAQGILSGRYKIIEIQEKGI